MPEACLWRPGAGSRGAAGAAGPELAAPGSLALARECRRCGACGRARQHAARSASKFFLSSRVPTPNEVASARNSFWFMFRTSLGVTSAAAMAGFRAAVAGAGGATCAWLKLTAP